MYTLISFLSIALYIISGFPALLIVLFPFVIIGLISYLVIGEFAYLLPSHLLDFIETNTFPNWSLSFRIIYISILIIIVFVMGSFLGWLYGKTKNHRLGQVNGNTS